MASTRDFVVSAPAKVIMYGEHAVVHGKVCIPVCELIVFFSWNSKNKSNRQFPSFVNCFIYIFIIFIGIDSSSALATVLLARRIPPRR